MKTFIYTLSNPITSEVRYVGKSNDPDYRLINHCKDKRLTKNKSWIMSLKLEGIKPRMEILDNVEECEWEFWEKYWISQFKAWGFNLNNLTAGGKGNYERNIYSSGKKAGGSKRGRKLSDETRRKMSISRIGNKHRLGIKHSPSARIKMSISQKGIKRNPHNEETKKLLSIKAKNQWLDGRGHHPLKYHFEMKP